LDAALDVGYRFIDTAQVYRNEQHIGKALQQLMPKYGLNRFDLFESRELPAIKQLY
jgi:diketogulonate reductase-like aldo/keto reductase